MSHGIIEGFSPVVGGGAVGFPQSRNWLLMVPYVHERMKVCATRWIYLPWRWVSCKVKRQQTRRNPSLVFRQQNRVGGTMPRARGRGSYS